MSRHREFKPTVNHSGSRITCVPGCTTVTQSLTGQKQWYICDDELGRGKDHGLLITKIDRKYTNLNGVHTNGPPNNFTWTYVNWDVHLTRAVPGHISTSPPSEASSMSDLLARTNPGRSEISLPTFVGEMKDFPMMIRQAGRLALTLKSLGRNLSRKGKIKEAANAYLGYKFGIAPLISDLKKILAFQDSTDKRIAELDRLYSKGGLRRRVNLWSDTKSSSSTTIIASEFGGSLLLTARVTTITKVKRWGTVRWIPTSPPQFITDSEKRAYARRLIFGLNAYSLGLAAWELLPWSWLADWFLNVQNLLEAHNNTVPAKAVNCCIMTQSDTTSDISRTSHPEYIGGDATFVRATKVRTLTTPALNTSLPFLNGSQLSILGALSVSKGIRRG